MNTIPRYKPQQWLIINNDRAFGQVINATETEQGWRYFVGVDGKDTEHYVMEYEVLGYVEDGSWRSTSKPSTAPHAHKPIKRMRFEP